MSKGGDWANSVGVGVEEKCLCGPLIEHVPYPEVLVAKAYSPTGKVRISARIAARLRTDRGVHRTSIWSSTQDASPASLRFSCPSCSRLGITLVLMDNALRPMQAVVLRLSCMSKVGQKSTSCILAYKSKLVLVRGKLHVR